VSDYQLLSGVGSIEKKPSHILPSFGKSRIHVVLFPELMFLGYESAGSRF
jgi:hypothetical protein